MEVLQLRIDTFKKSKRVKQGNGKKVVVVKWPHPDAIIATPAKLAEAGFYYNPSWEDQDNVACFMCGKELSGWEEDDDPFQIHWEKCKDTCAWAFIRCGLDGDIDRKGKCVFCASRLCVTDKMYFFLPVSCSKTHRECPMQSGWRKLDSPHSERILRGLMIMSRAMALHHLRYACWNSTLHLNQSNSY